MTRRSALVAGLAVLMVLLGGQTVSAWYRRPPSDVITGSNRPGPSASARPPLEASPRPTTTPGTTPSATPSRKPTGYAAMGVKMVTGGRGVVLTFDDGPHPDYTPQVLEVLRANHVRAVFCVVGTEVRKHPELVAQIAREGHTLCNHSWHHEIELGSMTAAKIRDNLNRTSAEILRAAPGAKIGYFRQPGGKWTVRGIRVARELGMVSLGWSVDPRDWEKPSGKVFRARVLAEAHHGAVILMHDGGGPRDGTVSGCRTTIPTLKQRYGVVPLG